MVPLCHVLPEPVLNAAFIVRSMLANSCRTICGTLAAGQQARGTGEMRGGLTVRQPGFFWRGHSSRALSLPDASM
jgi:hypothetical protein